MGSASTLTNAMMFLGLNPTWWNKLKEEQEKLRLEHGDALTPQQLEAAQAPLLDAVLKESLRMRTVIGGIPRKTLEDIEVDGVVIPKGWLIDPSMLLTHEEDPACKLENGEHLDAIKGFHPERWLSGSEFEKPTSDWYVPYGFGPRYCLGKNLAQLEMKIFLATMVRKIELPKLQMAPKGYYDEVSGGSIQTTNSDKYFPVEWNTGPGIIPTAADGVLATVTAAPINTEEAKDSVIDGIISGDYGTITVNNENGQSLVSSSTEEERLVQTYNNAPESIIESNYEGVTANNTLRP